MIRFLCRWLLMLALMPALSVHAGDDVPVVAVASNLQFAIQALAADFTEDTGRELNVVLGSSGNLARQIRSGAPFQLFLSADAAYVEDLYRDGLTPDEGAIYAQGRIALLVPKSSPLSLDDGLAGVADALSSGTLRRFAIPNPEHAPYGVRAREALQSAGLWESLQPVLVLGENVSQAAQFAASGNADAAITAWSLTLSEKVAERSRSLLLPADHSPLHQRMVLLPDAGDTARAFFDYLLSPSAQTILMAHGFTVDR